MTTPGAPGSYPAVREAVAGQRHVPASIGRRVASGTEWRVRAPWLIQALAVACTIGAGIALSAQFALAGIRSIGLAWPITHPEGATIAAILRVRDGQPLYQNYLQYPYLITPYPPVQPVVAGLISRTLGLPTQETIEVARSLTFAAGLAGTPLIWLAGRRLGASRLAALAGAGLFLPLPFLDEWGFAARPDVPAIFLSLLAMLLLIVQPRRVWLAAVVAVLALFTKQTAVALPFAATLWLLLLWRWRAAAVFAGVWVGLVVALAGLLQVSSSGTFVLNTVLAHLNTPKNGFDLAARDFLPFLHDDWLPVGLVVAAALLPGVRGRAALPSLYFGASAGLALYSLRNTGGDVNYLIEPTAAACVPAALAIDWLWHAGSRRGLASSPPQSHGRVERVPGGGRLAILGSVIVAAATIVWAAGLWEFGRLDGGVEPTSRLPLVEIAAAESVLSEEPLAVLLAGRPLVVSDTFHLSMLTTSEFFDPLDLERRIKRSDFDLIVMRSDIRAARWWKRQLLLPEGVRLAIKDTYVPAGRVGMFWLYRPEERRPSGR